MYHEARKLWQPEAINTTENRLSISQSAGPPVSGQHWPWLMWYFHSLLRLARWCSAQSRPASTPRMLSQHTENTPHGRDSDPSRSPDTTCNIVQHCHYRSIIFRLKNCRIPIFEIREKDSNPNPNNSIISDSETTRAAKEAACGCRAVVGSSTATATARCKAPAPTVICTC